MDHPPQPGFRPDGLVAAPAPIPAEHIEQSPQFRALRSDLRGFAFPVTVAFLLWYLLYVLLSCYAHDFMAGTLFGHITTALLLGLLQFASTFAIAAWYAAFAARRLDHRADELRERHTYGQLAAPWEVAE
ncbi:DUF485 domain-containing protein [Kitasatospora kifunensis]|uniref:Uncharacterized membrane protein (DUF485 family) n=1 Tax=Kitasatospora kifunensis TaxID=58351 RepID=A0A7W7R608_KITKI|nr:DUF485 domain-containing protein [Kitasatospora kifunensis]MBB4926001.1 uncharacterized membrane protein (DUF485 family) [Kitasatospora kifunensis]